MRFEDIYIRDFGILNNTKLDNLNPNFNIIGGGNRAGKTTLLKAITGILTPATGEINFNGQRIEMMSPDKIAEAGISLVPEGARVFPNFSVYENLKVGSYNKNARSQFQETITNIYELFPVLRDRLKQYAGSLSGGERQMLAIARSLMAQPKLMILDEPSLGLAPKTVKTVFSLIEDIKSKGYTILLVEQNAKIALEMADYGYLIDSGSIVFEGKRDEFDKNDYIKKAYLGL